MFFEAKKLEKHEKHVKRKNFRWTHFVNLLITISEHKSENFSFSRNTDFQIRKI